MMRMRDNWKRKIALFLISQSITLFGSQIVQMAVVWYVTLQTGSGAWVAAFSVCSYLPQFLGSFLGGVWADRYSRKLLIIGADVGIAAVTWGIYLMLPHISMNDGFMNGSLMNGSLMNGSSMNNSAENGMLLGMLLGMSLLRSAGAGIQSPAVNAVIPQLVPSEHLMRYNGINAAMQSAVQFAAPAVAGVVLTAGTLRSTLLIDMATAAAGIGLFACVRLPEGNGKKNGTVSAWTEMKSGIRYAILDKSIGRGLIIYGLFTFLCVPAGYLSGLFVSRVYGDTYWYLTAVECCGFGGMVAGGIMMSLWGGWKERGRTLCAGLTAFGIMAAGMGIVKSFPLYLVLMFLYGVALTSVQTALTTTLQQHVKAHMQGRIFGFMGAMYALCYPAGMVIFGLMADGLPLSWLMVGSGIGCLLLAVFCGRRK